MLMHRISHGAHIVEKDRVSMNLQAMQAFGVPHLNNIKYVDLAASLSQHLDPVCRFLFMEI